MKYLIVLMLVLAIPFVMAQEMSVSNVRQIAEIDSDISIQDVKNQDKSIMSMIPETYEETAENIPIRNRYILYTNNGRHIMWGMFGQGFFAGEDNHDKRVWGIYGNTVFAGFYDGEFFWGEYLRNRWKANGLFGLEKASGRYITFRNRPSLAISE